MSSFIWRRSGDAGVGDGAASLCVALAVATHGSLVWGAWHFALPMTAVVPLVVTGVLAMWGGALLRRRGMRSDADV